MATINLTYRGVKGRPLTAEEYDANLKELAEKLAPLDSPYFSGVPRVPTPGSGADLNQTAPIGWVREQLTGAQAEGNLTYALLGKKNIFTAPQILQDATANNEAATFGQLLSRGFEAGDIKFSLWPRAAGSGWVNFDGASYPSDSNTDPAQAPNKPIYADLFTKIGYTYGGTSGSGLFRVPDCRGRVLIGAGAGTGLTNRLTGSYLGEETHYLGYNEMVDHAHNYSYFNLGSPATFNPVSGGNNAAFRDNSLVTTGTTGIVNKGAQTAFNVMQPSLVIYMLVRL
jgi:microcystin-dependent protein